MRLVSTILSLVFSSLTALAGSGGTLMTPVREGFALSPQEQAMTAWNGTYAVVGENNGVPVTIASAVLVFKKTLGKDTYVGFLTARHVIDDNNAFIQSKQETGLGFSENVSLNFQTNAVSMTSLKGERIASPVSSSHDLGLYILKISDPVSTPVVSFSPTCTLTQGQKLSFIGYPMTYTRPVTAQNVEIQNPLLVTKRGSEGVFVGDQMRPKGFPGIVYGTTVDALQGNSGGAVVDKKGFLIGIVSGAKTLENSRFSGLEGKYNLISHSGIVDCGSAKRFAETAWQNFLLSLPQEI